jgi:hypothetical protein
VATAVVWTSATILLLLWRWRLLWGGGSLEPRTAIELSFSEGGGLEKPNRGRDRGETFFQTAVAIAIATRPFKFREISVSNSTSSFVSSIHRCGHRTVGHESTADRVVGHRCERKDGNTPFMFEIECLETKATLLSSSVSSFFHGMKDQRKGKEKPGWFEALSARSVKK